MKTKMKGTSMFAYFSVILPDIGPRQKEVLDVFIDNPTMDFTNTELADDLGRPINTITPRVYELRGKDKRFKLPLLVESRRRICKITRHMAIAWQMNPDMHSGGFKID